MVYINIPYVVENERIDRDRVTKELQILNIDEEAKHDAFAAIYNKRPRGVNFADKEQASLLEAALLRLGVPYRPSNESDYKYDTES
jgi:hypothetical protein